jgi:hypothetical protein
MDRMMAVDPQQFQQSWLPWWIPWAFSTISLVITGLLGMVVSFARDAHSIYRLKVDALEKSHTELKTQSITRDELAKRLEEMDKRSADRLNTAFSDMDVRRLQMHNHNADLLTGIGNRIGEVRADLAAIKTEFKDDINRVHERIDEIKK